MSNEYDQQIQALEAQIERLKAKKIATKKQIKSFEEINWEAVYDAVVLNFINPRLKTGVKDEDDSEYLYEFIMETICPNIFKD